MLEQECKSPSVNKIDIAESDNWLNVWRKKERRDRLLCWPKSSHFLEKKWGNYEERIIGVGIYHALNRWMTQNSSVGQRLENAQPKSCLPNQPICLGCCKALRHTLAMAFLLLLRKYSGHLPDKMSTRTGSKLLWLYSEQEVSNMQLILWKDQSMGTTEVRGEGR